MTMETTNRKYVCYRICDILKGRHCRRHKMHSEANDRKNKCAENVDVWTVLISMCFVLRSDGFSTVALRVNEFISKYGVCRVRCVYKDSCTHTRK